MSREVATREDSGDHCPDHVGTGPACTPIWCTNMDQAQMLEDRIGAIAWLVGQTREAALHGNGDVAEGLSMTAALEAARILARSILQDDDLRTPDSDDLLLWSVFTLSPRPLKLAAAPGDPPARAEGAP